MEETKTQDINQDKKLSYEEIKNIAAQLQQQNLQLRRVISEINYKNTFERLNYLFKVMEFSHMFDHTFTEKCVDEIESLMTIPENEEIEKDSSVEDKQD